MYKSLAKEIVLLSIVSPPYINTYISGKFLGIKFIFTLNSFLSTLSVFKLYIIFQTYALFSKWTNEDNLPICKRYGISPGVRFSIRSAFKRNPFQIIIYSIFLIMTYLIFILNFFEIGVFIGNVNDGFLKYTESIGTSYWIIAETCVTLGYGEVTPKSIIARVISIISVFFGWFFISLLILFSGVKIAFDNEENIAFIKYKRNEFEERTKEKATLVIKYVLELRLILINKKIKTHNLLLKNKNYQIWFFIDKFKNSNETDKINVSIHENKMIIL